MSSKKSILDGVDVMVDEWLELTSRGSTPLYQHRSAANQLNKRPSIPSSRDFLQKAYHQIHRNWCAAVDNERYSSSDENWRFTKRIKRAPGKKGEVGLERAIVRAADGRWANQVPTSSGLVGADSDKARNIDLVFRADNNHYSLIELKVGSNNPLYAAIEILQNGLLLAWSRNNQHNLSDKSLERPVLLATSIDLCVLAPSKYYEGLNLSNLSRSINEGLASCQNILRIPITFQFTEFPNGFGLNDTPEQLLEKAEMRIPIWWNVK